MSRIVKKLSAPYTLVAVNSGSTQFVVGENGTNNAEVTINGNLVVFGTHTSVSSTDTSITDNIITLNAGADANVALPAGSTSGIEVDRGSNEAAKLIWDEDTLHWKIGIGNTLSNIATQAFGNYLTALIEDPNPTLGANLQTNGFSIHDDNNIVLVPGTNTQIDSALQLQKVAVTPPTDIAGYNLVYAGNVAGGGSGIFVTNTHEANQELVTKKKAIVYSLIF